VGRTNTFLRSIVVLVYVLSFSWPGTSEAQEITAGAHYESQVQGRPRVIIFVHGFTGTSETTWKAKSGGNFPTLVASDNRIKQSNVFVASYDTHWTNDTSTINSLADKLFGQLNGAHVLADHQELIFVCHSLGGLVVERMLIGHPEIAAKTSFIQFYGTPHEGGFSETTNALVTFIATFGNSSVVSELRAGSGNKVLVELDQNWREKQFTNVRRLCAIEEYPTHLPRMPSVSGLVVPYFSGSYGCDNSVPIDTVYADHIDMVKTSDRTGKGNEAYLIFLRNYRDNPYYELRTSTDATRDFRQYLDVDCNHTNSNNDYPVVFDLNPSYKEQLLSASAYLEGRSNIKDVNPEPPKVTQIAAGTVHVQFGFNGVDKDTFGNCPGGGHATLVVHPVIQSHVPVPDGE
jgi:hypothetical protein